MGAGVCPGDGSGVGSGVGIGVGMDVGAVGAGVGTGVGSRVSLIDQLLGGLVVVHKLFVVGPMVPVPLLWPQRHRWCTDRLARVSELLESLAPITLIVFAPLVIMLVFLVVIGVLVMRLVIMRTQLALIQPDGACFLALQVQVNIDGEGLLVVGDDRDVDGSHDQAKRCPGLAVGHGSKQAETMCVGGIGNVLEP